MICLGARWIFFDLGLGHALGGKPSPSTNDRWFMVYNAGQAFEPLNKRTDWNWFCHGQSVERDTECSFGNHNLLHKKSLNKQWGAEQVPAISKATPH